MFHDDREPLEPEFEPVDPPKVPREQDGFYGTGNIDPPRRYAGVVAAVLLTVIFCGALLGVAMSRIHRSESVQETEGSQDQVLSMGSLLAGNLPMPTAAPNRADPQQSQAGDRLEISRTPDSVPNKPQEGGMSLQQIYKKVSPSVVSILAKTGTGAASGSGIIMSETGYIITNCHVVTGAKSLSVTLEDGRELAAELVGKDNLSDLAVLRIEAEGLTPAEFGNSDSVQVGDAVTAIGDPMGIELRGTMTDGIVSAINRNLSIQGRNLTLIQTSAALNEGNSGGPLINCYGQVIGINTAKIGDYYSSSGVEGLGFAIPINMAKEVVDQLISLGYVPGRPDLGIKVTVLSYEYQFWYALPDGLYVTEVPEGSNAWEAGIRAGDLITQVGSSRVASQEDLTAALSTYSAGDSVEIILVRSHRQYKGSVILSEAGG